MKWSKPWGFFYEGTQWYKNSSGQVIGMIRETSFETFVASYLSKRLGEFKTEGEARKAIEDEYNAYVKKATQKPGQS